MLHARSAAFCRLSVALLLTTSAVRGGIFTITDADFSGGVYDFTYYSTTNRAYVNGVEIPVNGLVMTDTGFSGPQGEGSGAYWYADGFFNATQLSGDITLGWDLSGISSSLDSVELRTNAALFQFSPWTAHAFEDRLYGEIATPNTFGTGAYMPYFEFQGNNNTATTNLTNFGLLEDVTASLSGSWLNDPNLFELRLGYEQHAIDGAHPNIPGKHLQVFRNVPGSGPALQLRLTADTATAAVPEPGSVSALAFGALLTAAARSFRRRQRRPAASA